MVFKLFWDWHLSPSSTHRSSYVSSGRREYERALRKYGRLDVYSYGDFRIWAIPQPTPQVYSVRQDRHGHIVKIHDRDSRRSVKRSREDRTSRVGVQHGRGRGDWLPDYDSSSSSSSSSYGSFGSCDPPSRQSSSRESDVILHTEYASSSSDSTLDGDPRNGRHKRSDWDDAHHGGRSSDHGDHRRSRRHPKASGWRSTAEIVDWPRKPKTSSRESRRRPPSRYDSSDSRIRSHRDGGTWRDV